jgi:hypothetical protein
MHRLSSHEQGARCNAMEQGFTQIDAQITFLASSSRGASKAAVLGGAYQEGMWVNRPMFDPCRSRYPCWW